MNKSFMGLICFGLANWIILIISAVLSVYWLHGVEPAWGYGGSLQVLIYLAFLCAFAATISFGLASAIIGRFSENRTSLFLGAICAVVSMALVALKNLLIGGFGLAGVLMIFAGISSLAPFSVHKKLTKND